MENEKTPEQIVIERFQELPQVVQDAFTKSGWQNKIRLIVNKYNLRVDQGAAVEQNVMLSMLGLISPNNLVSKIAEEAELSENIAKEIVADANKDIFVDIREQLIQLSEEEEIIEETEDIPTPKQPISNSEMNRESILKEIEDPEETIPNNLPVAKPETVPAAKPAPTTVAEKLQTPVSNEPKQVSFDPYREIPN